MYIYIPLTLTEISSTIFLKVIYFVQNKWSQYTLVPFNIVLHDINKSSNIRLQKFFFTCYTKFALAYLYTISTRILVHLNSRNDAFAFFWDTDSVSLFLVCRFVYHFLLRTLVLLGSTMFHLSQWRMQLKLTSQYHFFPFLSFHIFH